MKTMSADKTLYVKPSKQAKVVGKKEITVQDLAKLEGDQTLVEQMLPVVVMRVKKPDQEQKLYASFLDIAKAIRKVNPNVTLDCVGELDTMIMYAPEMKQPKKSVEFLKVLLVCIILFFGSALAIMTFHNDASVPDVLKIVHTIFTGEETDRPVLLIISYAAGIAIGIMSFFNHFGRKKLTDDPTPVQVEFVAYKKQIDDAVVDELENQQQ
jgi:stage V sporulation protein AA